LTRCPKDVDARDKPEHDEHRVGAALRICIAPYPIVPFLLNRSCFTWGRPPLETTNDPGDTAMAMTMNGEVQLAAPREMVWTKLNDPEVLKACIPGCEELEKTEDNGFRAVAKMKVGPVSARFKGRVTLSDLDPPNGYKISGEGEGGVAGFAKGGATVGLTDKDGGTLLKYDVEAQIGGKLAQLGQRLINGSAKKLADEFFANFAKAVQG
jgi:carbon monoxide dehydrogenase subunit G